MRHTIVDSYHSVILVIFTILLISGCASNTSQKPANSMLGFLYPNNKYPIETSGLPPSQSLWRIGVAFVPDGIGNQPNENTFSGRFVPIRSGNPLLSELQKIELMWEVANRFKNYPFVDKIKVVPTVYLKPGGSFNDLDQIGARYDVNVIVLLSFDQVQFTDTGLLLLNYWTLEGENVVKAEKNDTHTLTEAVVYDIPNRYLIFRVAGISNIKDKLPAISKVAMQNDSEMGYKAAKKSMFTKLEVKLNQLNNKL